MAQAKYVQEGKVIMFTNSDANNAVKYNQIVMLEDIIGVAAGDIAPNAAGNLQISGVFLMPAENTAAFKAGQNLYWDETKEIVTASETENKKIGVSIISKAQSESEVLIKIN